MKKTKAISVYDTATVARILSEASGHPLTPADVRNLTRQGNALQKALVRGGTRGTFKPQIVGVVANKMIRRRLAAELGRSSPRFLDNSHSRTCLQCQSVAVEWGGQIRCEAGHTYIESVDQGSPEGDHTAVTSIAQDGTILEIRIHPAGSEDE